MDFSKLTNEELEALKQQVDDEYRRRLGITVTRHGEYTTIVAYIPIPDAKLHESSGIKLIWPPKETHGED